MSEKIRSIIDEEGKVVAGAEIPSVDDDFLHRLYRLMLFNRRLDERMIKLQRQGRIGFFVGSIGEEAAIIGSAMALQSQDWVVPCYREAGAAFVKGYPLYEYLCQVYGNVEDKMKGRQMPCHWGSPELRLATVSSPVGSQIPHAVGLAMAARTQGKPEVAVTYFGDGATSTGDFHVSCNFAAVFKAPVIFLCRNNQFAISVPVSKQTVSDGIAIKAQAYGMRGVCVDGNDALAVYAATLEAADLARRGEGPTLIEAKTYRQGAHTTSDDPRAYRSDEEVEQWIRKDPIARLKIYLMESGRWDQDRDEQLESEIRNEIQTTLEKAEALPGPPIESLFDDVFDTVPWQLREQRESLLRAIQESD